MTASSTHWVLYRALCRVLYRVLYQVLHYRFFVGSLILFVLLARVMLAWLVDFKLVNDPAAYHQFAIGIAQGQGYVDMATGQPTAYWPIGYPAFLGAVYFLFGPSVFAGELANTGLSVFALWLAYDMTRRLFHHERLNNELLGRCLLLLLALYPPHWQYSLELSSEMLALCLVLLTMVLMLRQGIAVVILCGLVAGAAFLVKPQTIAVAGIAWLLCTKVHGETLCSLRYWGKLVGIYAIVAIMATVWSVRNTQVFDHPVLISTNGGINLFIGNNPQANGGYQEVPELHELLAIENEVARDREARRRMAWYFEQNPLAFWQRLSDKFYRLYGSDYQGSFAGKAPFSQSWAAVLVKTVCNAYYYGLVCLGFIGLMLLIKQARMALWSSGQAIPLVIVLWFTAVYMLFFGISRFHFLMMPFWCIYAAYGVVGLFHQSRWHKKPPYPNRSSKGGEYESHEAG